MKQINKFVTQIKLIFVVFGDVFNPEKFTKQVGILPSNTWVKGDEITTNSKFRRDGQSPQRKESAWEYSIDFIETLDFNDVAIQFEKTFGDKKGDIRNFIQENNLESSVNVVVEIAEGNVPSLNVSKNMICVLGEIGSELDFDIYVLESE